MQSIILGRGLVRKIMVLLVEELIDPSVSENI